MDLLEESRIHLVFVSQLKRHVGQATILSQLPVLDNDGLIVKEPLQVLERRCERQTK